MYQYSGDFRNILFKINEKNINKCQDGLTQGRTNEYEVVSLKYSFWDVIYQPLNSLVLSSVRALKP